MSRNLYFYLPVLFIMGIQSTEAQYGGSSNTNINIYLNPRPTYQSKMRNPDLSQKGVGLVDWGKTAQQGADTAISINDANDRSRAMNEQTKNMRLQNEMLLLELIKRKKERQQGEKRVQSQSQPYAATSQSGQQNGLIERANAGDIKAQYERARQCERLGNLDQALNWFIRAGSGGHAIAQMAVGKYFLEGIGREQNYEQALYWYTKAAEQGDPIAQLSVGTFYYLGWGCDVNKPIAVDWISKAAAQGNADAQELMGRSYFNGDGVVKDLKKARLWFHQAAVKGHANAQNGLGNTLAALDSHSAEAFTWHMAAAQQEHSEAMLIVALNYYKGTIISKDLDAGLLWHRKAAASGNLDAQSTLAMMLFLGHTLPADKKESLKWGELAAYQGDVQCMSLMATEKMAGNECDKDLVEAYAWINAACFLSPSDETTNLKQSVINLLPEDDMKSAQNRSKELMAKLAENGVL